MKFISTIKKSKLCGIYQIKNISNGKIYIGSSKTIEYRCYEHHKNLKKNQHDNQYLQNAWNKYGENNFTFEVIQECNEEDLIVKEQFAIDENQSAKRSHGYNICEIANKPWITQEIKDKISKTLKGNIPWNVGISHSEETKEKMRQAKLGICGKDHPRYGKVVSNETKEKIKKGNLKWIEENGATWTGKKHSEEAKEKMRQARLGSKLSQETKNKISKLNTGKVRSDKTLEKIRIAHKKQSKPVGQFLNDILIQRFDSISEARRITGIIKISECINGKRNRAGGFTWKLVD